VIKPPEAMLIRCIHPEPKQLETNRDLIYYLSELEYKFDVCAAQIDALRAFYGSE
jgi:hypothetical protein